MSKREEIRKKRQARARRSQLTVLGGIVVVALAVTGYLIYDNYQKQVEAAKPVGAIVSIEKETFPFANGKVLGSPEAKVLIQEFSDFQ